MPQLPGCHRSRLAGLPRRPRALVRRGRPQQQPGGRRAAPGSQAPTPRVADAEGNGTVHAMAVHARVKVEPTATSVVRRKRKWSWLATSPMQASHRQHLASCCIVELVGNQPNASISPAAPSQLLHSGAGRLPAQCKISHPLVVAEGWHLTLRRPGQGENVCSSDSAP
jgi:hypothetical protein